MVRRQKLKVYRTRIGFHDAYVAAPSQKAALTTWGADVDLFARGVTEVVDDEKLSRDPLEKPGTLIRVPRGSSSEHMAALPKDKPARRRSTAPTEDEGRPPRRRAGSQAKRRDSAAMLEERKKAPDPPCPEPPPKPRARAKPRPSRNRLDKAEKALEQAEAEHRDAVASIREQEKALKQKRRELESDHEKEVGKLEAAIAKARERYGAALQKWRA